MDESKKNKWVLPTLNGTFITLVPKGAATPSKFSPISLCKVIYKIITKVIANRLKSLFPILMSPEQMRYVEGRQILHGVILAHEVTHFENHQTSWHDSQA